MINNLNNILNGSCHCPVIIWGTKAAGQISCRLLQKLHIKIAAIGDNNAQMVGKTLYDIPILSVQQINELYPDALIIVSSFFRFVSDAIINQLKSNGKGFSFCRFEEIEYLYETEYLDRAVKNKDTLFHIINHVMPDEKCPWRRNLDKRIMSEYHYMVHDRKAKDLKEVLQKIYGVRDLMLIVRSENIQDTIELVNELSQYKNIGHINLVIESYISWDINILKGLVDKIFRLISDEAMTESEISALEKLGFLVQTKKISNEIFFQQKLNRDTPLTQKDIVRNVLKYVNTEKNHCRISLPEDEEPVHIVQLFNGLGNQALMYLFGRYLEEESDRTVIFDDTILCLDILDEKENIRRTQSWLSLWEPERVSAFVAETRKRNSFYQFKRAELAEVFDIPIRLLSDYFSEETWRSYLKKVKEEISCKYAQSFPLGQVLMKNGVDITVVRDNIVPNEYLEANHCWNLDAYILDMPCKRNTITDFLFHNNHNMYCIGVWSTGKVEDCYLYNRGWVRKQLPFRLELNEKNRNYVKEINQSDGIMIHIRRGDFVSLDISANSEYFQQSIRAVEAMQIYENKRYFVFSDDLEWCWQNIELLGLDKVKNKLVLVDGNTGTDAYVDLYLMSLGKVMISTPGSSFSYVAVLLSASIEKTVDIPRYIYEQGQGIAAIPTMIDLESGRESYGFSKC